MWGIDLNDWGEWSHTFIRMNEAENVAVLRSQQLDDYIHHQYRAEPSWPMLGVLFEPFADLSKHARTVNNDLGIGFPP